MRDTLLALFKLSQIDSAVLELEKSMSALPKRIGELEGELEVLRTELGQHVAEHEAGLKECQEMEGQVRDEAAKQHKWKRRLNDIRSPREYQALSREVEQSDRMARGIEEQILLNMEALEEKQKLIDELEEKLKAEEEVANGEISKLKAKQREMQKEIEAASVGRPEVAKNIPERILKMYERVRKRRGVGVSLTDGKCYGCNFVVRPQQMVEIRRLDSLEQCPQCHRIFILKSLAEGEG